MVFFEPYGAFVWDPIDGMENLGLYTVTDINDHGQIVGNTAMGSGEPFPDAMLYDDGTWYRIQDLTDVDRGNWQIAYAPAINDGGAIVVNAIALTAETIIQSGEVQPFFLSPIGGRGIPGDVDGDGSVGLSDLLLLLAAWGDCPSPPAECPADLDGDGIVGFADLLVLLNHWG